MFIGEKDDPGIQAGSYDQNPSRWSRFGLGPATRPDPDWWAWARARDSCLNGAPLSVSPPPWLN